jgi:glycyl-tRNA synthetase
MEKNDNLMDQIVSLTKQRGFIFPGSEIYGGLANSWDFGPLGVELKNNIKKHWWKTIVQKRMDMVGQDGAVIMNPKTWEASGHVGNFSDYLVECKKCHHRLRPDNLLSDGDSKIFIEKTQKIVESENTTEYQSGEIEKIREEIREMLNKNIKCPTCSSHEWTLPMMFNLMFKTSIGATADKLSIAYLRPETAQAIFVDFPIICQVSRKKIPFGVAQIGKAFRNEITPGNFIFRTREFEQMEIEYFFNPKEDWNQYFDMWLEVLKNWMDEVGIDKNKLFFHDIPDGERAHYSKRTIDIEYDFPFGRKELFGLAYRTDYDLSQHQKYSGKDMSYVDPVTQEKFIPHVIEPSLGVERALLAILVSAYKEEEAPTASGKMEKRIVLKLPKDLAPFKVAVLPLSKKPELEKVSLDVWKKVSQDWMSEYDITGSIGKRYRRQDEIGTPYCVTVDFDTLEDDAVTVRDRDTMKQERVKIEELKNYLVERLS